MARIFHWFFMWKMDPMSGCNIRLVFTLPPSDSTLQYKRCVHFWNNFPCITSLEETEITEQVFAFFLVVNENVIISWIKVLIVDFPFYRKRDNKMYLTVFLNEKLPFLNNLPGLLILFFTLCKNVWISKIQEINLKNKYIAQLANIFFSS